MAGCVMLCGVGSMLLVDYSLVQLFVSSNFSCIQLSHLTHSNAIVSVCIDLLAVMFVHCEHCIPYSTQL